MAAASELRSPLAGVYVHVGRAVGQWWGGLLHAMSQSGDSSDDVGATEDREDIRACLQGDHDAFDRIVERYQQQVGRLLWRFTHDRNEHEDLVHVTFVEAYISLVKYRGEGSFPAWLSTIATRVGYAYWKRQAKARSRNEVTLEKASEPVSAESESRDDADLERLEWALEKLSPRDRLVLTLLHLEENSVAEVARMTGWSQSLVKVQAHRARGRLKKLLEPFEDE